MTKSFVPVAFQSCTSPCLHSNGLPTDSSETKCKRSNHSVFNNALLQVGSNRTSKVEFRKLASCRALNRTIVQERLCNGTRIFRPPFIVYKTSRQKSSCTYSVSRWCCKNVSLEITLQFTRRKTHFRRRLRCFSCVALITREEQNSTTTQHRRPSERCESLPLKKRVTEKK